MQVFFYVVIDIKIIQFDNYRDIGTVSISNGKSFWRKHVNIFNEKNLRRKWNTLSEMLKMTKLLMHFWGKS